MIGKTIQQPSGYKAFIPNPFPPQAIFASSSQIIKKDSCASLMLGKLDGITQLLPDVDFFNFMYVQKDAAASSQIEGTKATMINAIEAQVQKPDSMPPDVDDILHYIKALNYGLNRLHEFPLSLRFIREIHRTLMEDARVTHFSDPGEFRKSQNWIGGKTPIDAEFVPPPVNQMHAALHDFEMFLVKIDPLPPLIKIALIHAQFETIHPFLDGNGRTGRILISLYLWREKLLEKPVLIFHPILRNTKKYIIKG